MKRKADPSNAVFTCRGCHKQFPNGSNLMKHLGQTECARLYPPKLVSLISNQHTPLFDLNDNDDFVNMDMDDATEIDDSQVLADQFFCEDNAMPSGHSVSLQVETALLNLIRESGAPLWLYKRVLEWASNAHKMGYQFTPERTTYQAQIKFLENSLNLSCLRPRHTVLMLEGHDHPITCVNFDFKAQFESLIQDEQLNQKENLVVNPRNHHYPYYPPDGLLDEVLSGSWYHHATNTLVSNPEEEFCCPIILSTDKTHVSMESEYHSHPVFFTLAIFNRKTRNNASAWRPLGYIHHPRKKRHQSRPTGFSKGAATRNMHQQLKVILDSLWHAQQPDSWTNNYPLKLAGVTKVIKLHLPIGPILCDAMGGDEICCRRIHYGEHATRICRTCDATPDGCGNPDIDCNRVKMSEFKDAFESQDLRKLDQLFSHNCENAFFRMNLGNDPYGVFSLCNTEILHAAKNGFVKHFLKDQFERFFGTRTCTKIDNISTWLALLPRQAAEGQFGRLRFKDGITNITNITADQRHCILKVLLIVLVTREGQKFVSKKQKTLADGSSMRMGLTGWQNHIQVVEMLLCFIAWASGDKFWSLTDDLGEDMALDSLKKLMRGLNELAPRSSGQGWDITKVHEIKHMAHDIARFGSPSNTNTSPTEHHHIVHAKRPAKTCRKERATFDVSVANRYVDNLVINVCHKKFLCDLVDPGSASFHHSCSKETVGCMTSTIQESTIGATRILLKFERPAGTPQGEYVAEQQWVTSSKGMPPLHNQLIDAVASWSGAKDLQIGYQVQLTGWTEYSRGGVSFRSHPNYQQCGPWKDWVYIDWSEPHGSIPARLELFLKDRQEQIHCVVHSGAAKPRQHSVLTRTFNMEMTEMGSPDFLVVPGHSIKHHTCVIPQSTNKNEVSMLEVIPADMWGGKFTDGTGTSELASDWEEESG